MGGAGEEEIGQVCGGDGMVWGGGQDRYRTGDGTGMGWEMG